MKDTNTNLVGFDGAQRSSSIELKTPSGWEFKAHGFAGICGLICILLIGLLLGFLY